jgi:transposase
MAKHKKDGRSIPRTTMEHLRFRAMKLRKKGWKVNDIAESFGLNRGSVSRWFTKFKRRGKKALKRTKAKGGKTKLNIENKKQILKWLKKSATDFGFETPLWTCLRVKQLIKKKLGISIHKSNVWEWLRKWNQTPQKPKRKAKECNEKEMKRWVEEEWPKIKKHARRWQAMIYFQDEAGISLTPVLGKTWAPKGKTPTVEVTGKRGGFCLTSAITLVGRMVFRIENKKINADLHIEFLKQIIKHHPNRKIIVVEDQAPSHIAKKVGAFVEENKRRFAVYYLPSYSPELNPDEHVWAYLKNHGLKDHQAQSTAELKKLTISKMKSIQRKKGRVKSFFYGSYVTQSTG